MTNAYQPLPDDAASREEFGRRADAVYDRCVKPNVTPADEGKFVAIDVDTGLYEVDDDELVALDRLQVRRPDASVWLARVGSRYAHRLGSGRAIDVT